MIFGRHSFVAFIVIAAIVSVFFSPLMPAAGFVGRHHTRANFAAAISPATVLSAFASHFVSSVTPQARAIHSEMLIALNCARLC
jgi:hypothetical protein